MEPCYVLWIKLQRICPSDIRLRVREQGVGEESNTGTIATASQLSMRVRLEPFVGYAYNMCFKSVAGIPERMASARRLMTSPASLPRI